MPTLDDEVKALQQQVSKLEDEHRATIGLIATLVNEWKKQGKPNEMCYILPAVILREADEFLGLTDEKGD